MSKHDSTCALIALSNSTGVHFPSLPLAEVGQVFGAWTVIGQSFFATADGSRREYAVCQCRCGKTSIHRLSLVVQGRTLSCGCVANEQARQREMTHGFRRHPLYAVLMSMIARCERPSAGRTYRDYGGRGISICPEWRNNKAAFITWALANGWEPGLQIDRINNDGNYEPSNCRFVTPSQNSNNRRPARKNYNAKGTILSIKDVAAIKELLRRGVKGRRLAEWFGVSESTISKIRVGKHWREIQATARGGTRRSD